MDNEAQRFEQEKAARTELALLITRNTRGGRERYVSLIVANKRPRLVSYRERVLARLADVVEDAPSYDEERPLAPGERWDW